jgi:hypothetical protein
MPIAEGLKNALKWSSHKQIIKGSLVKFIVLLLGLILNLSSPVQAQLLKEKVLIGRVEWVNFPELKIKLKARVDSGAKTSSMHAVKIEEVEQRGELYVKFQTVDEEGKVVELFRKVGTTQKVSNTSGSVSSRYVIKEKIKLGNIEREISINLNDRSSMDYKFLIGRNVLLGRFIVDVARSHVLGD